jgi:hypothetical protein
MPPSLKQAQAEATLQFCDPTRQGGFRAGGRARGSSNTAVAGDEVEINKRKKVHVFHL